MADPQENPEGQGSPFTRPAFLAAGVLVVVIIVIGVVLAFRVAGNGTTTPPSSAPPTASSAPGTNTPAPTDPGASICGLPAGSDSTLSSPPAATWEYEGTTAYPTSREFGPGKTANEGYRYCFQQSVSGALFASANAMVQATNPDLVRPWAEYFVSQQGDREIILAQLDQTRGNTQGTRFKIVGFKVLSYRDGRARVDIAVQASGSSRTIYAAAAYELIWEDGDWRANAAADQPFAFATVPDLSGYISWGE